MKTALLITLCLSLIACATKATKMRDTLDPQVGKLTYEEAVMTYGVPNRETGNMNVRICMWQWGGNGGVSVPAGRSAIYIPDAVETLIIRFVDGRMSDWRYDRK